MSLKEKIEKLIKDKLEGTSYFLTEVQFSEENGFINVFVDGDEGIDVEKCTELTRYVKNTVEEENNSEDSYAITVSSPGIDSPIKLKRQYKKNVGRKLVVTTNDEQQHEGKLVFYDDDKIVLKSGKNSLNNREIQFSDIREAKVKI